VRLGLQRVVGAIRRASAEALAAAGIVAAALVLALLAGDGGADFSRPAFDAAPPSPAPVSPGGDAAQAATDPEALARAALAGRLVEDPVFDREPPRDQQAPPPPAVLSPPPVDPAADRGEAKAEGDPLAVLSAASPPPADPALRVLERLRAQQSPAAAAAAPSSPSPPGSAAAALRPRFAIQLVAVGRRDQAERAWDRLRDENPDLLGRLQPIIAQPEQGSGALFRLRAGPLASVEDARTLCAALSGRGVDCIVVQGG
jgi:cell division septation protein DedD